VFTLRAQFFSKSKGLVQHNQRKDEEQSKKSVSTIEAFPFAISQTIIQAKIEKLSKTRVSIVQDLMTKLFLQMKIISTKIIVFK
jgi:hypothetical protein